MRECQTADCEAFGKPLGGLDKGYVATLYTRSRGTLPIRVVPLYCRSKSCFLGIERLIFILHAECKTTYRANYFVREASRPDALREYYGGVPAIIEVAEYSFVEAKLVGLFRNQMAFSQYVSAICALIPSTWPFL